MATLTFQGETYSCARAQKGSDFVRLLDDAGNIIFFADGITDFSGYVLSGGSWENPVAVIAPTVGAIATLSGGLVTLAVPETVNVETDLQINFVAPCDCTGVNGLVIRGKGYAIVDALGNSIVGVGGFFSAGSVVSVVLNVETQKAYIQNPATTRVSDNTATALGLSGGASVDTALAVIPDLVNWHVWEKNGATVERVVPILSTSREAETVGFSNEEYYMRYSDEIELVSGSVKLKNPVKFAFPSKSKLTSEYYDLLKGRYYTPCDTSDRNEIYYGDDTDPTPSLYGEEVYKYGYKVTGGKTEVDTPKYGYVSSKDETAYPQSGQAGEYFYKYVKQLGSGSKFETGSYKGSGTYGANAPNSLTFGFEPKLVIISTSSNGEINGNHNATFGIWAKTGSNPSLMLVFSANNYQGNKTGSTSYWYWNAATLNGNTLSWYYTDADRQLNSNGQYYMPYHYIAIG